MAIATLTGVSYWYPNEAKASLRDVNLSLESGLTVVAGLSGGGKSTLLRVLNGLVPHFHGGRVAGRAVVAGMSVFDTPTRRLARTVGFVFQDPELQTVYDSVEREVAFGLENVAMPPGEMPARVEEALTSAGALHLAGRSIRTLSGGERQRVALASALAMRPQIVVLDEPTSQLDPDGAAMVLDASAGLARRGCAVIIAEHRLEALAPLASAMVLVEKGTVCAIVPGDWRPPAPPARVRSGGSGAEAWSLTAVAGGFGSRAVFEGATVAGHAGEVVALTGPNGGGKTTLLRLIAGALEPLAGHVERRAGRIAYLPQNPTALLHRPTLRSEVAITLERSGEREHPDAILKALGLTHVGDRYPRDLSCGERQRAALAAVLPGMPSLVLLDEPTRGMDTVARDALIALVARLRDAGSSIVMATHDVSLRAALADTVLHVAGGRVTQVSTPASVARGIEVVTA